MVAIRSSFGWCRKVLSFLSVLAFALVATRPATAAQLQGITFEDIAYLTDGPYFAFEKKEKNQETPDGFTLLRAFKHKSGIQAALYEQNETGTVIYSIAGTQFSDPRDILADLGMGTVELQALMSKGIGDLVDGAKEIPKPVRKKVKKAFRSIFGIKVNKKVSQVQDALKSGPVISTKLRRQIKNGITFFDEVVGSQKSNGDVIKENEIVIAGHSLGGYIAQVIAVERKPLRVVTFNAPGADTFVKGRPANTQVTNHVRKADIVGNIGKHVGDTYRYRNAKFKWSRVHKTIFIANHSMKIFKRDIRKRGIKAKGT